jgi:hypothetical protein
MSERYDPDGAWGRRAMSEQEQTPQDRRSETPHMTWREIARDPRTWLCLVVILLVLWGTKP